MRPRVVIAETLDDHCAAWLAERAEVVRCEPGDAGDLHTQLCTADALIVRTYTRVDADLLAAAPQLKVVARAGVGLDNIDLDACKRRDVAVVYTPDANTQAVVEYVFALIFDALRPRRTLTTPVDAGTFRELRKTCVGTQLDTLTLGIVGLGRIGKRVGQVAHALGVNLLVNDLLPEASLRKQATYPCDFVDKYALYAHSDIVTLHVDGRTDNRHMIDADALSHFNPTGLLINTSRGFVIDTAALTLWLSDHPDAQVVLDVHDPEPPSPTASPLWNVPNARLLPHLASRTHTAMRNMAWVVRDVVAVLEGAQPRYPAC